MGGKCQSGKFENTGIASEMLFKNGAFQAPFLYQLDSATGKAGDRSCWSLTKVTLTRCDISMYGIQMRAPISVRTNSLIVSGSNMGSCGNTMETNQASAGINTREVSTMPM